MSTGFSLVVVSLLTFLISQNSWSQNCPRVRLDDPGLPFSQMEIVNQGDTELCYAFAAKQMIEYQLLASGMSKDEIPKFDVLEIAANAKMDPDRNPKDHSDPDDLGQSSVGIAINHSLKEGLCNLPRGSAEHSPKDLGPFLKFLREAKAEKLDSNSCQCHSPGCNLLANKILPFLSSDKVMKSFFESCQQRVQLSHLPEATDEDHFEPDTNLHVQEITELIHKNLTAAHPQPVAVGFCWNLIGNRQLQSIKNGRIDRKLCPVGLHGALVIGQKEVGGRCQFLIRNSYGKDCKAQKYDWPCKDGQFWVDAEALGQNTVYTSVMGRR